MTGQRPTLIVIRGNSGSGKTTTARQVRTRYGRGCALIEQDHLRRIILREHDTGGIDVAAPAVIAATARAALEHHFHVIVEGMLLSARYGDMLRDLIARHQGPAHVFYLDVSLEETLRRHSLKPGMEDVTDDHLRGWYVERDLLHIAGERVIPETSTFEETVDTILHHSGLAGAAPLSDCPTRCAHCTEATPTPPAASS